MERRAVFKIWGREIDSEGRCAHYHQNNDIVGLKCSTCQKYFACYQCHDELMDHSFKACDKTDYPAICGKCRNIINFEDYKEGSCIHCHAPFNPNCHRHWSIYFK